MKGISDGPMAHFGSPHVDNLAQHYVDRIGPIVPDLVDANEIEEICDLPDGFVADLEYHRAGPKWMTVNKPFHGYLYRLVDVQDWWNRPDAQAAIEFLLSAGQTEFPA